MADFKDILLHIFSQTKGLEGFGEDKQLQNFEKSKQYAFGGKISQENQKNLQSIFDGLGKDDKPQGYYFEPKELSLENFNFPTKDKKGDTKAVFDKFQEEYKDIKGFEKGKAFAETCLALLEKYFCYVPCGIKDLEEVSLYQYIKSIFSFMTCMSKSDNFLLFGADISGIQNFIYNIASQKASKSLKGRSFYLQLLLESIIQEIIQHEDINLTKGNIIYASGGKFYMLLPDTPKVKEALEIIEKRIIKEIYEEHKGDLYVCMDCVELNDKSKLSNLWRELAEKMSSKKQQKFSSIFLTKDGFKEFFEAKGNGGNTEVCAVTGLEGKLAVLDKDDNVKVLPSVKKQSDLGRYLKDIDNLLIGKKSNYSHDSIITPLNLSTSFSVDDNLNQFDFDTVSKINKTNIHLGNNKVISNFFFYGGNKQAMFDKGKEKTFEDLAGEGYFKRLGVLRMDVDNLGKLFINGIPENKRYFATYATLSQQLDLFFSGYLNTIRNQFNQDKFKDWVNIIYSGGDDVFAVGRWDLLIDFAKEIRDKFREYVCHREDISISAGLVLIGQKFPIAKGADMAGEAEEQAKDFTNDYLNVKQKNAICFLGETVSWEQEFGFVEIITKDLISWLQDKKISKSILQRFFQFREIKNEGKEDWRWLSAYLFHRQEKESKKGKDELGKLKNLFFTGEYLDSHNQRHKFSTNRALDLLCLASRWAELKIRTQN